MYNYSKIFYISVLVVLFSLLSLGFSIDSREYYRSHSDSGYYKYNYRVQRNHSHYYWRHGRHHFRPHGFTHGIHVRFPHGRHHLYHGGHHGGHGH